MLSILLLGPPRLLDENTPVRVSRRKSRALVYYLAAHEQAQTREQLLRLFWPDLERAAAQQALRTTLHGLRQSLGGAMVVDDDHVGLAPEVRVDARQLVIALGSPGALSTPAASAALALSVPGQLSGTLRAALALYRGDFLEGFSLPDSPGFDDWAAIERERYRRLAVRGLAALAQQHEAAGDYPAALEALERALAFDALQEDLQRAALRLHYLAGDRASAIRRYAHLRQLLDAELGVLPMAETRALYDAIVSDQVPAAGGALGHGPGLAPAAPPPAAGPPSTGERPAEAAPAGPPATLGPLPFAGRDSELAALRRLLDEAPARRRLALLEGEPGIGKTRLAEEFMQASGALVLRGAAREQEQPLPYQLIIEALRGLLAQAAWPSLQASLAASLPPLWLAEVARLLPELLPAQAIQAAAPDESRLWEGAHQFLLRLAPGRVVCLFVDDLQWADASTRALLSYLLRRARQDGAPLVFLGAARPAAGSSPHRQWLQKLAREDALLRVPLERLDAAAVRQISLPWLAAEGLVPEPLDELVAWLARASEGNPYVLAELVRYVREHGLLQPDGGLDPRVLSETPLVPQNIYALIQTRLAELSEPARRVLDAAVAAGREFEFEVVYRAAGLSETAALDALDELAAAGLFLPLPTEPSGAGARGGPPGQAPRARYAFDHSLTMEVAYREVGEPRHRLMHRRLAEALEQVYGRQRLDGIAGMIAYNFAEGSAPERAAPYAFRAGQLAAGLAAWSEAVAFYELALPGESHPEQRLRLYLALAYAHFRAGQIAPSAEVLRLALTLALEQEDSAAVETAQLALARAHMLQARFAEAIRLARELRAATDDPRVAAAAEFTWATVLSIEGADLAEAAAHLAQVEKLLALAGDGGAPAQAEGPFPMMRIGLAQVKFEQGSLCAQQGDLDRAVALYQEALALAERTDDVDLMPFQVLIHNNLAYHLHLLQPDDPAAQAHAEAGLRLARALGALGLQPYLHSTRGEIALALGDLAAAEAHFQEGLALAERLPVPERVAGLTANLGRLAQQRGESALAIHRLSTALAQADALGTRHLAAQIRLWLAPLLPAAEARARLNEARHLAESGGRRRLLAEADRLDAELNAPPPSSQRRLNAAQ